MRLPHHGEEPLCRRSIAGAVGLDDDGPRLRTAQNVSYHLHRDSGMNFQNGNSRVEPFVKNRTCIPVRRFQNQTGIIAYVDSGLGKRWKVLTAECLEVIRAHFCCAVTPHQEIVKIDADLRHYSVTVGISRGSDLHCRYEVFFSVRSRHSDRQLASGEYDRLGKSLYHKAERRRRVGHRVGAVKNYKTVVFVILVIYKIRKFQPHRRLNVRRVDYRAEGI